MEDNIKFSNDMMVVLSIMQRDVIANRSQFATPEHFLKALLKMQAFETTLDYWDVECADLEEGLQEWLDNLEHVPDDIFYTPEFSVQMMDIIEIASNHVNSSNAAAIDVPHCVNALLQAQGLLCRQSPD